MNRLYRKEIKEFFNVLTTHHVAKLEKPDDSEFGGSQVNCCEVMFDGYGSNSKLTLEQWIFCFSFWIHIPRRIDCKRWHGHS